MEKTWSRHRKSGRGRSREVVICRRFQLWGFQYKQQIPWERTIIGINTNIEETWNFK